MSMNDIFGIGTSGVKAYRAAMGAISENIANATTAGYNRRSIELSESPSGSATSQFYKSGVSFGGVIVSGVVRGNDPYLDHAGRVAAANYASADTRLTWQGDIQSALDDGALGVGQLLGSMFAATERLAGNPSDTTLRQNVLYSFEQINTTFKQTYQALNDVSGGITSTASNEVIALNQASKSLAYANEALRRAEPGTANEAQLLDERDTALSAITSRLDVTITFRDHGAADVTYNGATVVSGTEPHVFAVTAAANGTLSFTLDTNAVAAPQNGTLAGLTQSAATLATRVTSLNTLAQQYVTDVNTWHKAGYTSLVAGVPTGAGTDMLSPWVAGTSNAGNISLLISDPTKIAAVASDGRLNGNLIDINSIRGTTGIENNWNSIVAAQANLLNGVKIEQQATSTRNDQAQNARAEVSGVDLDREAADLLRFQQAYQGCARVIQVARECVDALFNAL